MKKHSKTGVESRFQGTVLGHPSDPKPIRIEGGPADSIHEWCLKTRERAARLAKEKPEQPNHVDHYMDAAEDTLMDSQ
jgi:transcription initiation factor TFIID subunit 3